MALSATIHRCHLQVSDLDRGHYGSYPLNVARHPSETVRRMMVRLLAFALHADEALRFTRGLSETREPDLWLRSPSDEVMLWIEVGQPDEKRIRRACNRARNVALYCYQHHASVQWWRQVAGRLASLDNLHVLRVPDAVGHDLEGLADRNMDLQCTIQEGQIWFSDTQRQLTFALETLYPG